MAVKKPELYELAAGFIHKVFDPKEAEGLGQIVEICRVYNNGFLLDDRYEIEENYSDIIANFYISNPSGGRAFIDECVPKIEADMMNAARQRIPDLTADECVVVSEVSLQISLDLYSKFEGIGAFGVFVEQVLEALDIEKFRKHKLAEEIERLHLVLNYWYKHEANWRESDDMPTEFGIGYITGLLSSALDIKPEWWALKDVYERVGGQLTTNQQAKRGSQKGSGWTTGMEAWLKEKVEALPTKKTKNGITLSPSNRAFAESIKTEAMRFRHSGYGSKWPNEQAAFEWIQKTLSKILNS